MKSKANIKGHPLHPMLVGFPIAFFTATLLSDAAGVLTGEYFFIRMGTYLEAAGVVSGFLAAVPGVIDYAYSVPPKSSAQQRAVKHGILNSSMLLLFLTVLLFRWNREMNLYVLLLLEATGVTLMSSAAWLGGTLVHRNQVGVDHRYANAGKWKEQRLKKDRRLVLEGTEKIKTDQMKLLHVGDQRIVLARTEEKLAAFDDFCSHRGGPLSDGVLICGTVQCPWHGSQFDVKSGKVKAGPAKKDIRTFTVEQQEQGPFLVTE